MSICIDEFEKMYSSTESLKFLRNKILNLAMRGKLTKQHELGENSKELLNEIREYNKLNFKIRDKGLKSIEEFEESEIPYDIPNHWCWTTLNELALIRRGASPRPIKAFVTEDVDGVNWIKIGDATAGGKYITSVKEKITPEGADKSVFLNKGSLIMSNSMSFGKAYILGVDGCIHDGWLSFTYSEELIVPELFQFFLNGSYDLFAEKAVGTGVKNLNIDRVKITPFPLPPVSEQKEIIKIIESYNRRIDELEEKFKKKELLLIHFPHAVVDAIGNYETEGQLREQLEFVIANFEEIFQTPESMQELRNVILQLAIEGKLVPQEQSDEPAKELVHRIKDERNQLVKEKKIKKPNKTEPIDETDVPFVIPESWEWVRATDICHMINYGYTAKALEEDTGTKMLRITDIQNGKVNWETVPFCSIEADKVPGYVLHVNDVVIARTGGTVGKSFIVKNIEYQSVYASYLIRLLPSGEINCDYFYQYLQSPYYWVQLTDGARGGAQPNVNATTLGELIIPLPPFEEQQRIVDKIESLMEIIDKLEYQIEKKSHITSLLGSV